ncbi:MAG: CDP-diacylglycerol--glycerol-3-phosphate 3-phosphatidyltransferase [Cyanobacterium sp. T60_A2020_053]|nr:CDP-diacylglycerol--glycerol-3-phosphate 3-phosphatidyltransferase [Cyanobacterium sp. T60_A2020_053]
MLNIPNSVTVTRIVAVIPLTIFLYQDKIIFQWLAFGLFILASATDWLDGYLARRLDQITELGKFLDPLTDKILVSAPLLILIERQVIPAWGVFLIIIREMVIAGWRVNPQLTQQNSLQGANIWGKLKTVTQITAIAMMIMPEFMMINQIGIIVFWLSVILTLYSGLIYLI